MLRRVRLDHANGAGAEVVARIRDWERKAFAATIALAVCTLYALHKSASFAEYSNVVLWILGIYVGAQAGQQVGFAKFGLLTGNGQGQGQSAKKTSVSPAVERAP